MSNINHLVYNFLYGIGCCKRCILLFLDVKENSKYQSLASVEQEIEKILKCDDVNKKVRFKIDYEYY